MATLLKGDCIELMKRLRKGSVDLILCDLPYGITDCRWDKKIPLAPLWKSYDRVLKDDGAVLLFAQQPFATHLAANASVSLKLRYEWIWDKGAVTGFQNANRMPMRRHENIFVFYRRLPSYHPQGLVAARIHRDRKRRASEVYGAIGHRTKQRFTGYPASLIAFRREPGAAPCQKPVALLEYLIRTYSNRGDLVLDNCMGTGSTGVAAVRAGRRFIGMELDPDRFRIARDRMAAAEKPGLPAAAGHAS